MSISIADVKLLRKITGAGVLDCKKALQASDGDLDKAKGFLRKKGLATASKRAGRDAHEGLVNAKISDDGKVGVMIEINCETDFVARTEQFGNLLDSLLQQIIEQPELDNVEALLVAPYRNDKNKTVNAQLTETIATLGENMVIRRVARVELEGDGIIDSYVHSNGKIGVLVEVAGNAPDNNQFVELAHNLALQVAAAFPSYINESDVPAEVVESEKDIYHAQLANEKKPDNIKERIVEGKLKKWYSEVVLLNQVFVKDSGLTITNLLENYSKEYDSPVKIRGFNRFELGDR